MVDPNGRAVWGVGLLSLPCRDCGFEFRRVHVCLSWVLCVVRLRSLRRADHSYRGVVPSVVCQCDRGTSWRSPTSGCRTVRNNWIVFLLLLWMRIKYLFATIPTLSLCVSEIRSHAALRRQKIRVLFIARLTAVNNTYTAIILKHVSFIYLKRGFRQVSVLRPLSEKSCFDHSQWNDTKGFKVNKNYSH